MSDQYVPTRAGLAVAAMVAAADEQRQVWAELTADTRGMVAAMREAAHDDEWVGGDERPTPEKVLAIADFIEGALPVESEVDARRLATRLRHVGLGPREER